MHSLALGTKGHCHCFSWVDLVLIQAHLARTISVKPLAFDTSMADMDLIPTW